jgi:hypothetical protein
MATNLVDDATYLGQLKDGLIAGWCELPPEHQAALRLVLLRDMMKTDYQVWLSDAIQRQYPEINKPPL